MTPLFSSCLASSARRAAACGLAAALACAAAPAQAAAPTSPQATLRTAVHYVVPPFVGGAKVRTPEAVDTQLAQALADQLHARLQTTPISILKFGGGAQPATPEGAGSSFTIPAQADLALVSMPDGATPPASTVAIDTKYVSRPMAIMRSDTAIKSWEQLKGRTVCVSEGGLYAGTLAAQYGAVEKIYKAPADSLLALRTGGCDAAVHDDVMLKELLKLPEWKKFSATLAPPANAKSSLAFIVPASQAETIATAKDLVKQWRRQDYLNALNKKRVQDIAFEVYLDQVIPDCH
ncbi:transporter substrate-binding domain-containing protein [Eoetvoesiella caeni]|uniref:Polar amino acid transport system substrate-binding protein n=1 Tax=Eoetvoesiella caeni TaxID=645616 RepID=A0A366HC77_9BURK|nr:transporter substrate-binding domain-containing protein [Eoetvoesiella caeni]MCI2809555.1 transporter substrate-binding domain-containing protein [Eoetvoesiella caeni]NYT56051.1 transporter substrate-binding domain-containing protein [Eoetvoesiella caeni]RBP38815.1 polar amino acid transport system substrate-binding protein [Eoetvoesiella caeni]